VIVSSLINANNKKWWVLAALSISLGMALIDQTGVAIALPKIQQEFHLSSTSLQWIVNAYLLVLAIALIIGGHLGDLFHPGRIYLVGLVIFVIASCNCALAPNITWLIINRAIQGFGAGLFLPSSMVTIIEIFGERDKGKAMGIYMGSSLLFVPLSLVVGGVFTQFFSWRLIFWINLPLSIICFSIAYHLAKSLPSIQKKSFDWLGVIVSTIAISTLVIALMESSHLGWGSTAIKTLLGVSLVFFFICYYLGRQNLISIIDFSLFHQRLFLCAAFISFSTAIFSALFVFDSIFYQEVLGFKPMTAGMLFFINIFSVMLASPISGRVYDKFGYKIPLLGGLSLMFIGLLSYALLIPLQNYWYYIPSILCINIALPFASFPIRTEALFRIETRKRGVASGLFRVITQISRSITLALLMTIIYGSEHYFLAEFLKKNQQTYPNLSVFDLERILIHSSDINPAQFNSLKEVVKSSYAISYSIGIYAVASLILISLLFSFFCLKEKANAKK
jgi:EmrB/QacA subfamily drug resistance transporter